MADKLILILTLSLLFSSSMADISFADLEAAIFALQLNGFNLFGNSIAVSDLSVQILSHKLNSTTSSTFHGVGHRGFTFLAPPNSALFSLDMSTDAFTYVHSLRFHVVPRRLSISDLRNISLSENPHLETLIPGHVLSVACSGRRRISIDGVRVSFPDLYLRSGIAVHGLDGILFSSNEEFLHRLDSVTTPPPPPIVGFPAFSPEIEPSSSPADDFERASAPNSFAQQIGEIPAYSPEFVGSPTISPEINAFSPRIAESRSPVTAAIPVSHDVAFTGGSINSISIPPIDAYSSVYENIPSPSPSLSMEYLSPDEYSMSPEYADWLHSQFLSPNSWLPDYVTPPPFTVGG